MIEKRVEQKNRVNTPGIAEYERDYIVACDSVGVQLDERRFELTPPDIDAMVDFVGRGIDTACDRHNIRSLAVGASGDLDSNTLVALLAEHEKRSGRGRGLHVFHARFSDRNNEATGRVARLLHYAGQDMPHEAPELEIFDLRQTYAAMLSDLGHDEVREQAHGRMHYGKRTRDLDNRERSNIMHELMTPLRGTLAREKGASIVATQQATELMLGNYTTSDMQAVLGPLFTMPKTALAHWFGNYLRGSKGRLPAGLFRDNFINPGTFYPANLEIENTGDGVRISPLFDTTVAEEFILTTSQSTIPPDIIAQFRMTPNGYAYIPGAFQWAMDPALHVFMRFGFDRGVVDALCEEYPGKTADIHLAALLYENARGELAKEHYFLRVPRIVT